MSLIAIENVTKIYDGGPLQVEALKDINLTIEHARERKVKVEEILVEVGLKDYLHKRPDYMSGGQQQRVAVARALVKKPKLVLAEKPTANLDSETGDMIIHLMLA